jgi:hypothetical protein
MITAIARFDSYTGAVKALTANVCVVGWSAGGNRAVLTMARYGDRFPGLKWYASWESPMLSPVDGGWGTTYQFKHCATARKCHFGCGSVRSRQSRLASRRFVPGRERRRSIQPRHRLAFWVAYDSPDVGQPRKAFYTPTVIREARDRQVFGPTWPSHIATLEEVEQRASTKTPRDTCETPWVVSLTSLSLSLSQRLGTLPQLLTILTRLPR